MRVHSAIDTKSRVMVFSAIAFITAAFLYLTIGAGFTLYELAIGASAVLLASSFLLWILFGTYYDLYEDYLYCKSGPFSAVIFFDDIRGISLSDNACTGLALSSCRIVIRQCDEEYMTISPRYRERFISYLKARCRYLDDKSAE